MSHFYDPATAEPRHFVPCKTRDGDRPTTIADARKNGWVPGVTTVLGVMAKPALIEWLRREAIMAALTTPRLAGEGDDAFAARVLAVDAESDAKRGRDLGGQIHDAIEAMLAGKPYPDEMHPYVEGIPKLIEPLGRVLWSERTLAGPDYGGRADLLTRGQFVYNLIDFKSGKKVADKVWPEWAMQLSAYAPLILRELPAIGLQCWIVSVSTTNPGEIRLLEAPPWEPIFENAFKPALKLWQHLNQFGAKEINSSRPLA